MKKSLFFVAAAAVVLASCSSDVKISENVALEGSNAQKEIAFSTMAQKPRRAAGDAEYNAVETNAFPQNYDMKVVAYSVPKKGTRGNYFGSAVANAAPLFSYQFAGGAKNAVANANYWGGNPAQYWPLAPATLNFLAVTNNGSPTADVVSETFASNYASQVTVTLTGNTPQAATTGLGQHDLMYAFGRDSVWQEDNTLHFPTKVDMTFEHAEAWVCFRVKAGNPASKAIAIKGIKLNGAYYSGTFQATVNNYDTTTTAKPLGWVAANTKWTAVSGERINDIYSPNVVPDTIGAAGAGSNDSKKITNASFTGIGDGILVVPTSELTSTASIASIDIEYYLNGNLYTYNYVPAELTYGKGKKYIYDITMTLHEIYVNASVANWGDGGTTEVAIP